jgi:hypothetical protein
VPGDGPRHIGAVAPEHAAKIADLEPQEPPERTVDDPRRAAAKERILAVEAVRPDDVVSALELGHDPGDLLGRVLEVAVESDDPRSAGRVEPGEHGSVLAEVPSEADNAQARQRGGGFSQQPVRPVRRPVVDADDLERPIERPEDAENALEERGMPLSSLRSGITTEIAGPASFSIPGRDSNRPSTEAKRCSRHPAASLASPGDHRERPEPFERRGAWRSAATSWISRRNASPSVRRPPNTVPSRQDFQVDVVPAAGEGFPNPLRVGVLARQDLEQLARPHVHRYGGRPLGRRARPLQRGPSGCEPISSQREDDCVPADADVQRGPGERAFLVVGERQAVDPSVADARNIELQVSRLESTRRELRPTLESAQELAAIRHFEGDDCLRLAVRCRVQHRGDIELVQAIE